MRCSARAVVTMTYDYAEATAVVGPLSPVAQKGALDLCEEHANTVTVPRGWSMVRLVTEYEPAPPSDNDLMALADAIKAVSKKAAPDPTPPAPRRAEAPGPRPDASPRPRLRPVPQPKENDE